MLFLSDIHSAPLVLNLLSSFLLLLLENFKQLRHFLPLSFSPPAAQRANIFFQTATSRSLICFNVDFRLNGGRLLQRRRVKSDCRRLIGRRPTRRCINSSSLSLCSNFSTLLFLQKPFHQVNVKLTWNVHLLQQSPPRRSEISFHEKILQKKKEKPAGARKRPSQTRCPPLPPPLFPSYGIVQLTVSIMWRGSHLIKLVQAVQSLKRGGVRARERVVLGGGIALTSVKVGKLSNTN